MPQQLIALAIFAVSKEEVSNHFNFWAANRIDKRTILAIEVLDVKIIKLSQMEVLKPHSRQCNGMISAYTADACDSDARGFDFLLVCRRDEAEISNESLIIAPCAL
jgi:hypothetical protein